jgi:hypothetical protein
MQKQKKDLEGEITELKDRLEHAEAVRQSQDYEKSKFMEGAVWFGKKMTNEVEKLC